MSVTPSTTQPLTEGPRRSQGAFPTLAHETRAAVPTDNAAYHLNRKPQTLRKWACLENGPIRPVRINGRLAWRVCDLQALLAGEVA